MPTNSVENENNVNRPLSGVKVLCGDIAGAQSTAPRRPFDDTVIEFLSALSKDLMKAPEAKKYPEVITFAFFCRKGNLLQLKKAYEDRISNWVGRGLAFHIAPSNVPVNFAYTLISGLLAGNANIVKASSRDFEQVRIISSAIARTAEQFPEMAPYATVVIYDRNRQDLTEYFSAACNVRVIWGGDRTIASVRRAPILPRTVELCFADRYSLAVISAEAILSASEEEMKALAQGFYNDTYLYDQNACTSPRLIYWLGKDKQADEAKAKFWQAVYDNIKDRYSIEPESVVDKRMAVCRTAIAVEGSQVEKNPWDTDSCIIRDNRITRVAIPRLDRSLPDLRGNCGFWQEYTDISLEPVAEIVNERYQTLGYYGYKKKSLLNFVISHGLKGIDRIVPLGHTADFSLIWDGYDLISECSRELIV